MTADVTDALATFVADPFLVREGEQCHLPFEIKNRAGDVFPAHAMSDDGLDYEYNQVIIPPTGRAAHAPLRLQTRRGVVHDAVARQ